MTPEELAGLLAAVGWGDATGDPAAVGRSIERYPFVAAPTRSIRARFKEHLESGAHPIDYKVGGANRVLHEELSSRGG